MWNADYMNPLTCNKSVLSKTQNDMIINHIIHCARNTLNAQMIKDTLTQM